MSEKNIYAVTLPDDRNIAYVQAESKTKAKSFATSGVQARKLSGREILSLVNRGLAIVDADTGLMLSEGSDNADFAVGGTD